jgi:polyhydroxybutyrate depolymerase
MGMTALLAALLAFGEPERATWTVDGVVREGLVCAPSAKPDAKPPLVFGFHGHGGSMQNAARSFRLHEEWPDAMVVYLQGLPTPGRLTDPEGKRPGWQHAAGEQSDRDLKLFDAVLAWAREKHRIDEKRVYASGHSNGGAFTYVLWGARPGVFAAVAPSAAVGTRAAATAKPCPLLHVGGRKDPLVRFEIQMRGLEAVRAANGCEEAGKDWGAPGCTIWASSKSAPVVAFVHDGDHAYPREAPALLVKFFKEHALP